MAIIRHYPRLPRPPHDLSPLATVLLLTSIVCSPAPARHHNAGAGAKLGLAFITWGQAGDYSVKSVFSKGFEYLEKPGNEKHQCAYMYTHDTILNEQI